MPGMTPEFMALSSKHWLLVPSALLPYSVPEGVEYRSAAWKPAATPATVAEVTLA